MRGIGLAGGIALGLAGCLATGCGPRADHTAATARPRAAAATAGWRIVSFHGVHVELPAAWPVVDGMHAGWCFSPFPSPPTVFVGPDDNPPVSCPPPAPGHVPARDGVWIAPGGRPSAARPVTVSPHVTVLQTRPGWNRRVLNLWYWHVAIEIGIGPDPRIAHKIIGSIGYTRGAPDTRDSGDCARAGGPARMPRPARLARRLVIEQGDITLNPPRPSDRPVMTAAAAWQQAGAQQDQITASFLRYQLLLVRYSAKFPARPGPDGTYVPMDRNVLAWVVYSRPRTPIPGCVGWGLDSFNALTGQGISSDGWSPGP